MLLQRHFWLVALWRVLDKTSAPLRGADKHPPPPKQNWIKVNRYHRRKSKNGNEKSGFARRLSAKPRFFLLPVSLNCAVSIFCVWLTQNYRFCNSREFTACACLDINEHKNGVLLYTHILPQMYHLWLWRVCLSW